jgi:hypothetical protein
MKRVPLDVGAKFGRLTVIGRADPLVKTYHGRPHSFFRVHCRCDCGSESVVVEKDLRAGHSKSCGCLRDELRYGRNTTHGDCGDGRRRAVEYTAWTMMKARCLNERNMYFYNYGGRGIKVCGRWLNGEEGKSGYECFLADMGRKPSPRHSLDRYPDNEGDYEPNNCRWATRQAQNRNSRSNHLIEFRGRLITIAEACDISGVNYKTAWGRLDRGMSVEATFAGPRP